MRKISKVATVGLSFILALAQPVSAIAAYRGAEPTPDVSVAADAEISQETDAAADPSGSLVAVSEGDSTNVIVNKENFLEYFDSDGTLNNTTAETISFEGDFEMSSAFDPAITQITIPRTVNIVSVGGERAYFENVTFNITADGVSLKGLKIDCDGGAAIKVTGAKGVSIKDNVIDMTVSEEKKGSESFALYANNTDGLLFEENEVQFTGKTNWSSSNSTFPRTMAVCIESGSTMSGIILNKNKFDITVPSCQGVNDIDDSMQLFHSPVASVVRMCNCPNLQFTSNSVKLKTVEYVGYDEQVDEKGIVGAVSIANAVGTAVYPYDAADHVIIRDNTIEGTGDYRIYGIDIDAEKAEISKNDIKIESNDYGFGVYCDRIREGEYNINENTINVSGKKYVSGIRIRGDMDLNIKDNIIDFSGALLGYGIISKHPSYGVVHEEGNTVTGTGNITGGIVVHGIEECYINKNTLNMQGTNDQKIIVIDYPGYGPKYGEVNELIPSFGILVYTSSAATILENDIHSTDTGIISRTRSTISSNVVYSKGEYTVDVSEKEDSKNSNEKGKAEVKFNVLYATEKTGNESVCYKNNEIVQDEVSDNGTFEVVITKDNFFEHFDSNGTLANRMAKKIFFQGSFQGLSVSDITINREVRIDSSDSETASFENVCFNITEDNVSLKDLKIKNDGGTAVKVTNADNVSVTGNDIEVTVSDSRKGTESFALYANDANGLLFEDNQVSFAGKTDWDGTATDNITRTMAVCVESENHMSGIVLNRNTFDITIPSCQIRYVETPPGSWNYVPRPVTAGIYVSKCPDLQVTDNDIRVGYDGVIGNYDVIYALDINEADDSSSGEEGSSSRVVVSGNVINGTGNNFIYGLNLDTDKAEIIDNEMKLSSKYSATGVSCSDDDETELTISANAITMSSEVTAFGLYVSGDKELTALDNTITWEDSYAGYGIHAAGVGKATVSENTVTGSGALTYGIALASSDDCLINKNTLDMKGTNETRSDISLSGNFPFISSLGIYVTSAKTASIMENDIKSTDTGIRSLTASEITGNTVRCRGDYTVITDEKESGKSGNAVCAIVQNNTLYARESRGDESVLSASGDVVSKNLPSESAAWESVRTEAINTTVSKNACKLDVNKDRVVITFDSLGTDSDGKPCADYTGKAVMPLPTVTFDGVELKKNADYTVSYKNNKTPGTAVVTVKGTGEFKGSVKSEFVINRVDLGDCSIFVNDVIIKGSKIKSTVKVYSENGVVIPASNYTVTYPESPATGEALATITAKEKSKILSVGSASASFNILTKETDKSALISNAMVKNVKALEYTGEGVVQSGVEVKDSKGNVLTEGTHYELSYINNVNVGTAIMMIKGCGDYHGVKFINFKIKAKKITYNTEKKDIDVTLSSISENRIAYHFTGYAIKPQPQLVFNYASLTEGVDYTLSWSKNTNVTNEKSRAVLKIKLKGNFSGTITENFDIVPYEWSGIKASMESSQIDTASKKA
ncbi:MAG: hypothetical protein K6E33_00630, partial [Lachnospiraceae bacterium]|nr:hypothetical protein [Lachnospiraceae bacterium]